MSFVPGGTWKSKMRLLTDDELQRVMEQVTRYGFPRDRPRWRAIFTLLIAYGPRISEALMLTWSAVDFEQKRITFPTLKRWRKLPDGTRERIPVTRTLPLLDDVADALREYLETAPRGDAMFPGNIKTAKHVASDAFRAMLERAGIGHRRLHDLRHTAASRILQHTRDLLTARDTLGHANIATTNQYLHAIDLEEKLRSVPMPFRGPESGGGDKQPVSPSPPLAPKPTNAPASPPPAPPAKVSRPRAEAKPRRRARVEPMAKSGVPESPEELMKMWESATPATPDEGLSADTTELAYGAGPARFLLDLEAIALVLSKPDYARSRIADLARERYERMGGDDPVKFTGEPAEAWLIKMVLMYADDREELEDFALGRKADLRRYTKEEIRSARTMVRRWWRHHLTWLPLEGETAGA